MTEYSYSYLKIFKHQKKLQEIKDGIVSAPISLRIKPTNRCNTNCFYCSYKNIKEYSRRGFSINPNDEIPLDVMIQLIDDINDMKIKSVILTGGGEPLIYSHISYLLEVLKEMNIDLGIITNGIKLSGENADLLTSAKWVRISLDSCDEQNYSNIRNATKSEFNTVIDNIFKFSKKKEKSCELGINNVINHMNYMDVYPFAEHMKNLGVNHVKYSARVTTNSNEYHKDFSSDVISDINKAQKEFENESFKIINVYEEQLGDCVKYYRTYSKCPIQQIIPSIGADSCIYLCHDKAYMNDGKIGDLKNDTFKNIWFSDNVKEIFKLFDAKKRCIHHCANDQRNMIINEYLNLNDNNINFI